MAHAASQQGTTGAPFAKFIELGDTLIGAFASDPGACRRQRRKYGTTDLEYKPDGKPLLEEIMHFVAMPGTTARTGNAENGWTVITPGTHVRWAVLGYKWGQIINARKELPAHGEFPPGTELSGDVYTIRLGGWSTVTENAAAATRAGFAVVDGRIILPTQEDKDRYVLAQSRSGGNTNPAKDFDIEIRRTTPADAEWEALADDLYLAKPWEQTAAPVDDGHEDRPHPADADVDYSDDEPF